MDVGSDRGLTLEAVVMIEPLSEGAVALSVDARAWKQRSRRIDKLTPGGRRSQVQIQWVKRACHCGR